MVVELVKHSFVHRVKKHEIRPADAVEDRTTKYRLEINDPRIEPIDDTDLYVRGSEGWEPAEAFSRRGVGSVFREIRLEPGRASIEFADFANQLVNDPAGMKLKFLIRPTIDELKS